MASASSSSPGTSTTGARPRASIGATFTWRVASMLGHLPVPKRRATLILALILPVLALRVFTGFWPFLETLWTSFTNKNVYEPTRFVGIDNYRRGLTNTEVRGSLWFTLWYSLAATAIEIVVGFYLATLLNKPIRFQKVLRTAFLMPWAIPAIVTALGFRFLFSDGFGVIPHLLGGIGIHISWLTDPQAAQWATIIATAWRTIPFIAIMFLAGMQGIPEELFEAATVDGASSRQVVFRIVLPLVAPLVITMSLFMIVFQLGGFDIILGMTGGGPGTATQVLSYLSYKEAFLAQNQGRAASEAMILFVLVLIVGGIGLRLSRRFEVEQ